MNLQRNLGLVAVLFAALIGAATHDGAQAQTTHDYEIAADDGYGLQDCLAGGAQCGQVVADAWCEAHGQVRAIAFGTKTAVEESPTRVATGNEPYVIRCTD